jgi:hypothetical protein
MRAIEDEINMRAVKPKHLQAYLDEFVAQSEPCATLSKNPCPTWLSVAEALGLQ